MAIEEKGKETKIRKCICCGEMTTVTKFMSDKVVKCEECKKTNQPIDESIISEIEGNKKTKQQATNDSSPINADGKKSAICTLCQEPMMIGKFASAKTCVCDDCKGITDGENQYDDGDDDGDGEPKSKNKPKIDLSRIDRSMLPTLDEAYVMPQLINNRKLRQVVCPACGHEFMKIIKIIDSSPSHGLVLVYQCHKCLVSMTVSEQSINKMSASPMYKLFNYRAEDISGLGDGITELRVRNSLEYLLKLCQDNNIFVDGNMLPEKVLAVMKKPIDIGVNPNWEAEINDK